MPTVTELRAQLGELGQPTQGTKPELEQRFVQCAFDLKGRCEALQRMQHGQQQQQQQQKSNGEAKCQVDVAGVEYGHRRYGWSLFGLLYLGLLVVFFKQTTALPYKVLAAGVRKLSIIGIFWPVSSNSWSWWVLDHSVPFAMLVTWVLLLWPVYKKARSVVYRY
eukprot:SAG31_NODE_7342_length_1714_cov_1.106502_1_plen_164_part_00